MASDMLLFRQFMVVTLNLMIRIMKHFEAIDLLFLKISEVLNFMG